MLRRYCTQAKQGRAAAEPGMNMRAAASGEVGPALQPGRTKKDLSTMRRYAVFLTRCLPILAALSLAACATTHAPPAADPADATPSSSQAAS